MHKDIMDPLDAEASGRCANENEQKAGGDKAVASRARHRTSPCMGVGGDEDGASCARHRTSMTQFNCPHASRTLVPCSSDFV